MRHAHARSGLAVLLLWSAVIVTACGSSQQPSASGGGGATFGSGGTTASSSSVVTSSVVTSSAVTSSAVTSGSGGSCSMPSDCPVTDPCQTSSCELPAGTCSYGTVPDGTPTPGVTQTPGDCHEQVCMSGTSTSAVDDTDLPPAESDCADPTCTAGTPGQSFAAHPAGSACSTFMGNLAGFCDGMGHCEQCTEDSECAGATTDCQHPSCASGACTAVFTPAGTPTTTNPPQVAGDCQTIECDGKGGTQSVANDADLPSSSSVCVTGICTNGVPSTTHHPGLACPTPSGPLQCTASGACGCQTNTDCTAPATCNGSGECVLGAGQTCSASAQCQSGNCVDGVCCNTTCTGTCQACNVSGHVGTCSDVPSGQTDPGTCAGPSSCDGAGVCVAAGECTWASGPAASPGEITCYWLGQGTAMGGGCGSYKTYCGYCGSESGSNNGGACPTGITDTVANTGTSPYFAAFPAGSFGQGKYCGMCVEVTYGSKSVIATIVDECATCPSGNHIDLSLSTAVALGLGQGGTTGDATNGVTWEAVDCPVTGDIVAVYNNGYAGQLYFQDVVFPVAAATAGGHTGTQAYGYWDFGTSVAGQSITLTDTLGHVVTGTVPGASGGSVGTQFPAVCH